MIRSSRPRSRPIWLIPAVALVAVLGVPPLLAGRPVFGPDTPTLIRDVLVSPLSYAIPELLPLAKLVMVVVAVLAVVGIRHSARILVAYYAAVLVLVAMFQNAADLDGRGFAFLAGNAVAQLALAAACLVALRSTTAQPGPLRTGRTWALPLAFLAASFPYTTVDQNAVPGIDGVFTNGAGVTYCMVAAVVAAAMFVRPDAYPGWLRVLIGTVGVLFGLLNAVTWFVLAPQSWWMGVLHLPLLVCSAVLLATSWAEARTSRTLSLPAEGVRG